MKNINWAIINQYYNSGMRHFDGYIFDSTSANMSLYSNLDTLDLSVLIKDENDSLKIAFSNCEFKINLFCNNVKIEATSPYTLFNDVIFQKNVEFFRSTFEYDLTISNS